jgi:hypothetical protein
VLQALILLEWGEPPATVGQLAKANTKDKSNLAADNADDADR